MKNKLLGFLKKFKYELGIFSVMLIAGLIFSLNYSILVVQGESMFPTFSDGNIILIEKADKPIKQDIVVFNSPKEWSITFESKDFIKRIVASEGDKVTVSNELLKVNDEVVGEISDKKCELDKEKTFVVEPGKYFMVGDNYSNSNDSLLHFCKGEDNYLIDEKDIVLSGKGKILIGGK